MCINIKVVTPVYVNFKQPSYSTELLLLGRLIRMGIDLDPRSLTSFQYMYSSIRLSARWSYPPPPLGNFADIPYFKEQSFLHRIRDVCTL